MRSDRCKISLAAQAIEQSLCVLQIRGVEALGEPAINFRVSKCVRPSLFRPVLVFIDAYWFPI